MWTATELGKAAASDSEADEASSFPAAPAAHSAESANGNGTASGTTGGKAGGGEAGPASPKPTKKQRWTPEHRKNLSEAIKAKWREPAYRQKIIAHMRDPSCQDKRVESRRVRLCWLLCALAFTGLGRPQGCRVCVSLCCPSLGLGYLVLPSSYKPCD